MSKINLIGYNASEFSFTNKLRNGTQIKLGNNYNFNVKYTPDNTCFGEMKVKVFDREHEDQFCLNLTLVAKFTYSDGSDKEAIHVECFKSLFPFARAIISSFSAVSGIPPIMIPEADIESQNIYRVNLSNDNTN